MKKVKDLQIGDQVIFDGHKWMVVGKDESGGAFVSCCDDLTIKERLKYSGYPRPTQEILFEVFMEKVGNAILEEANKEMEAKQ